MNVSHVLVYLKKLILSGLTTNENCRVCCHTESLEMCNNAFCVWLLNCRVYIVVICIFKHCILLLNFQL